MQGAKSIQNLQEPSWKIHLLCGEYYKECRHIHLLLKYQIGSGMHKRFHFAKGENNICNPCPEVYPSASCEGKKSFSRFSLQFLQPGAKPEDSNVLCSAEVLCLIQKIQHPFPIFCFLIQV